MKNISYFQKFIFIYILFLINIYLPPTVFSALPVSNIPSVNLSKTSPFPERKFIKKRIEELKNLIRESQTAAPSEMAEQLGISVSDIQDRIRKLIAVQSVYESIMGAMDFRETLKSDEKALMEKIRIQEQSGMSRNPPYSLSFYDNLLDTLTTAAQEAVNYSEAVNVAKKTLEDAWERAESEQKKWRQINEEISASSENKSLKSSWILMGATLDKEYAEILYLFEKIDLENLQKKKHTADFSIRFNQFQINWVRKRIQFDENDLNKQIEKIRIEKSYLKDRLQNTINQQKKDEDQWRMTLWKLSSSLETGASALREAALKAHNAWRNTWQNMQEDMLRMIQLLDRQETVWKHRYLILKNQYVEHVFKWDEEARNSLQNIKREINLKQRHQGNIHLQISALEKQIIDEVLESGIKPHLRKQFNAMLEMQQERVKYIEFLSAAALLEKKLLNEIELKYDKFSAKEIYTEVKEKLKESWDYEIWKIDERPVTVRKLIIGFAIFLIGILIAKFFIRLIYTRIFHEKAASSNSALFFQKIFSYFAYTMAALFALRIVNVPLEAFAFLGGALAIGVGFGAQNLFNNFLSWFIIIGEGAVNIGDLVEIDGVLGKVEDIGARRTRIRTGENIDILVPNSSFLEKNVTNWTMMDRNIRTFVSVGVMYGTPPRKVEELLLSAADQIKNVLKKPEPFVIFNKFGENALIFEVHFWIYVERIIERRMIQGEMRFQICKLFEEAGIVIAFPQRDVHIDSLSPINVKVLKEN